MDTRSRLSHTKTEFEWESTMRSPWRQEWVVPVGNKRDLALESADIAAAEVSHMRLKSRDGVSAVRAVVRSKVVSLLRSAHYYSSSS